MLYKIKRGIQNSYLIEGTNNYTSDSILSSINHIEKLDWKSDKVCIIIESDTKAILSEDTEQQFLEHINSGSITDCYVVNPIRKATKLRKSASLDQFISTLGNHPIKDAMVFIFGAENKQVRRLSNHLMENKTDTYLEVSLDAITHNLNFYKNIVNPPNRIMAMVKANAYGHGIVEVAHHLKDKVEYFGVAYVNEGIVLRKQNVHTPIMVMNPSDDDFELCLAYDLEPEIHHLNALIQLIALVTNKKSRINIQLEINTGMNRLGFDSEELDELIRLLKSSTSIHVNGIYSHLACAEDENEDAFNKEQLKRFNGIAAKIETELGITTIKHIRNSAGSLRYPDSPTDMIRPGIGLYGVESNKLYQDKLATISRLKSRISQIRRVKKGETIGYNRTFKAEKDMTIATIAIGYADGYWRAFSNGIGKMMIHNRIVPVVGRVNMDMTMVDITNVEAKEGEEVIIFNEELTATSIANIAGTIPYEIFTSIGERVGKTYTIQL